MEIDIQTSKIKMKPDELIFVFNSLQEQDKQLVFKSIYREIFKKEWIKLDKELPDVEISTEEIMEEIKAVRNGKKD